MDRLRRLYLRNALHALPEGQTLTDADMAFLAADTKSTPTYVREVLHTAHMPVFLVEAVWRHAGEVRVAYGAYGRHELVEGRDLRPYNT